MEKEQVPWVDEGDLNTKYFHCLVNQRRNINSIWELDGLDGAKIIRQQQLKKEAERYFKDFFMALGNISIINHLRVVHNYPRFLSEVEGRKVAGLFTLNELMVVLVGFSKSRRPGPDGWIMEFFLAFFDLVGQDLLVMLEESRIKGHVSRDLNATFLAVISKCDNPASFINFRPIYLCNLVYKVILNIIANQIKPILSKFVSKEQFGFLENR